MNAQTLYDRIKEALAFFGLRFAEMGQMTVEFEPDRIVFTYGGYMCAFPLDEV